MIKSDAENKRAREKDRAIRFERSLGGWDGDKNGGDGGGDASGSTSGRGAGFGSKRLPRFAKDAGGSEGMGRRFGFGGGSGAKGNKRDLNAAGHHAGGLAGHPMDIDEMIGCDGINEAERRVKRSIGISARA